MEVEEYHYDAEFSLDGVVFGIETAKEDVLHIRDHFQFLEDDIVVATYPKSGTTWMQEIIYCLRHGPGASEHRDQSLQEVFPCMEFSYTSERSGLETISSLPTPRLIKTHLPSGYFKRQLENQSTCPKFVIVMRNPKDVLTSFYHFHKMWAGELAFPKHWGYFFGMFQDKRLLYGDCFDHMVGWWNYRNHPRVLVMKYEDLKKDAKGNIQKVEEFLGSTKNSNVDLETIVHETSFYKMKSRPITKTFETHSVESHEGFYRKGIVGSWKELFQAEQENYIDTRMFNELNSVGISFD